MCKTRRTVRGTFQLIAVVSQNNDVVLSEIDVNTSFTDKNGLYVICEFDFVGENTHLKAQASDRKTEVKAFAGRGLCPEVKAGPRNTAEQARDTHKETLFALNIAYSCLPRSTW